LMARVRNEHRVWACTIFCAGGNLCHVFEYEKKKTFHHVSGEKVTGKTRHGRALRENGPATGRGRAGGEKTRDQKNKHAGESVGWGADGCARGWNIYI
jgi:hypothetical protein